MTEALPGVPSLTWNYRRDPTNTTFCGITTQALKLAGYGHIVRTGSNGLEYVVADTSEEWDATFPVKVNPPDGLLGAIDDPDPPSAAKAVNEIRRWFLTLSLSGLSPAARTIISLVREHEGLGGVLRRLAVDMDSIEYVADFCRRIQEQPRVSEPSALEGDRS
jgi:hypothetical protein